MIIIKSLEFSDNFPCPTDEFLDNIKNIGPVTTINDLVSYNTSDEYAKKIIEVVKDVVNEKFNVGD